MPLASVGQRPASIALWKKLSSTPSLTAFCDPAVAEELRRKTLHEAGAVVADARFHILEHLGRGTTGVIGGLLLKGHD
jgi:hypothetical protein